ncbi:flavin reductase family protein [Pusillimonas sp. TS35]|uniref:flavin reductase family protein n=1 Tax=Paracandidimonas lactea TaxID=2895524 RepID=UPI00136CFEEE|nr:flavin reductase family protein [Paracandidimonas lactea]MYN12828.1 flavin reductase family protein [Pusillimonas sp. TS35]
MSVSQTLAACAGRHHVSVDFSQISARERYKLLIGAVVPRPIALVTTRSTDGVANAAPYSFFNCLSADPAIVALGVENHEDVSFKDTARNIRMTEVFTVNIVDMALMDAMNTCAVPFPPNVDELAAAGLTPMPGVAVDCPYILESPIALECRRYVTLNVGRSREIIMGQVVRMHIREDILDAQRFYVDQAGLDAVGRMGGHAYASTRDLFDLPTMSVAQWESKQSERLRMPATQEAVPT